MAPLEADAAARSNIVPYTLFSSHILLVITLTFNVLDTARCAAKSLSPATKTRNQDPLRRNYAILFSVLAALSLSSVAAFSIVWRVIEYIRWADQGGSDWPNSLWKGWYANDATKWHIGDWTRDIDLVREWSLISVATPEGFLWTSQQYVGLLASAIFMGVEGRRRNLDAATIGSFVLLSATGSLSYSLSLFFVTILYTPLTVHSDDTPLQDALFAPSPVVYYVPILASLLAMNWLPDFIALNADIRVLRLTITFGVPLFLAFAPRIVPVALGRQHTSKAAAHRSYSKVFHFLAIASFLLYWRLFSKTVLSNKETTHHQFWNIFDNTLGLTSERTQANQLFRGLSTTGHRLKQVSKHPAISATSLDVLFSVTSLLAWTLTRALDVEAVLENSIFSMLVPSHEKHVAFEDNVKRIIDNVHSEPEVEETPLESLTPRKRGRPAKNKTAINGGSTAATASVRRSGRRSTRSADHDSDKESVAGSVADSTYEPTETTKRDVAETESDGAITSDFVHGGESAAFGLFLTFLGGLGQLASSALGAEVSGPRT